MAATIKAIEGRSVHQIQAGQVIVDLNSVVKELVENSLDAGASSIEIRFKNNGLDGLEVQDNGTGISPADYGSVALKHQTSKLASYGDLDTLQTFGFRGEALSSLCAVARVSVVTARKEDGARGARLEFEASGQLKSTAVAAAQKGTLVGVEGLFEKLPVRRRELEKNIKREYGKVLGLLHAYACVSTGVRFAVSNHAAKGKKAVVFSTKANPTTRENIANVYGAKTLAALIPLDLDLEMTPTSTTTTTSSASHTAVHIVGHISRPVVGEGRQTPDRQLFFVNSRPCALPQVSKAVNEVYKSFNVTQSPFVFADLRLDTAAYDVNVSPDKRTILLHDQTALLDALKDALAKLFEAHDQSVPQAQSQLGGARKGALSQFKPLSFRTTPAVDDDRGEDNEELPASSAPVERNGSSISLIQQFAGRNATDRSQLPARKSSASKSRTESPDTQSGAETAQKDGEQVRPEQQNDQSAMDIDDAADTADNTTPSAPTTPAAVSLHVQDFNARLASQQQHHRTPSPHPFRTPSQGPTTTSTAESPITVLAPPSSQRQTSPKPLINAFDRMRPKRAPPGSETATITIGDNTTTMTIGTPPSFKRRRGEGEEEGSQDEDATKKAREDARVAAMIAKAEEAATRPTHDTLRRATNALKSSARKNAPLRLAQRLNASTAQIEQALARLGELVGGDGDADVDAEGECEGDASLPESAEEKLALTVSKRDFARMRVVGQFNLGFILAVRPASHAQTQTQGASSSSSSAAADELFIIDQHASDEKVNFERLASTTVLEPQRLVRPLRLDFTALEEEIIQDNAAAFAANGFLLDVDTTGDEPVGQRCRLLGLPLSRETVFGVPDLEELVALLGEGEEGEAAEAGGAVPLVSGAGGNGGAGVGAAGAAPKHIPRPAKVRRMLASRACVACWIAWAGLINPGIVRMGGRR
ncbi:uncharacterized protein K452DRAFT_354206 [Aplosporella prunicola CBS 121167]|uniref:DNA mismatch repair protein S5 domain-containing protein n=1 Tax=Aplosporella prunicola CBS 121167 TaxID=1176127 RepID=A0A6A6AY17_9PEZI|nr:uncharacterized protein K452DRAFT_354206 [Aplosporella prunicola CBS 121167]KAF2135854.1 hypothetical protein K452DRAFT_354206 [Aplosporella prunicola CBS 121167]